MYTRKKNNMSDKEPLLKKSTKQFSVDDDGNGNNKRLSASAYDKNE